MYDIVIFFLYSSNGKTTDWIPVILVMVHVEKTICFTVKLVTPSLQTYVLADPQSHNPN